jgi:GWxTD domain-containing protein
MGGACRILTLTILAGSLLGPDVVATAGSKLSKDDRRWLDRVDPLITPEEVELFERTDARDRDRFQQIFWARRDPESGTAHNELRDELEARRGLADRQFRQPGLSGSATDMGHVFLLLGPPSRVARGRIQDGKGPIEDEECDVCDVELESSLIMKVGPTAGLEETTYITWRYDPDPLVGIPRGLDVEFRSLSTLGYRLVRSHDVERALERARRLCVCDPTLGYELDAEGRLAVDPLATRPESPLERALMSAPDPAGTAPRVTFRALPAFFRSEGGASYAPVLLEIEPRSLTWHDGVAEVTVSGCLDAVGGERPERFRFRAGLARDPDGRVRFDLPFTLSPGRHELRLAVQDDASARVGARVLRLMVPDFPPGAPKLSSVVAYVEAREVGSSPPTPGRAFQFGRLRVAPRRAFRRDDSLGLLYYVYGLEGSPDASPMVQYTLFRDGKLSARTPQSPLPVSGSQAVGNTEIPLESFAPGPYSLRVTVTAPGSGISLIRSIEFEVKATPP